MKLEQVEVTIGTDGKVQIRTSGFTGEDCLSATEGLESLLGDQIVQRELTSEISEPAAVRSAEKVKIRR